MKIDKEKKIITLTKQDILESECPLDERWAVRMLQIYGIEGLKPGSKLYRFARCPEIAKKAYEPHGWKVIVEDEKVKSERG